MTERDDPINELEHPPDSGEIKPVDHRRARVERLTRARFAWASAPRESPSRTKKL